ncbi:MAG: hypothetical protein ACI9UA_005372 [Pseudoalteromonas tetraodonis]|jgi:hypothetical protein
MPIEVPASGAIAGIYARVDSDAPPFLPISDPFNGSLTRPTQKANS